ncbi:hypothetical protein R6Q59_020205 [Mikania micrantha]
MPYESRFQLHFSNPHENFKSYLSSSFCSPDEYESVAPPPMVAAAMWCTGVSIPLRIGKASNFESGRDEYHRLRCSFVHSLISMEEEASGTLPHQGLNNSDGSNEGRVSSPNEGIDVIIVSNKEEENSRRFSPVDAGVVQSIISYQRAAPAKHRDKERYISSIEILMSS